MAISAALLVGVLALGPGNPLGDMPAYLDAMEAGAQGERAEAQVVEALSRHAQGFAQAKRLARGAAGGASVPPFIPKISRIQIDGDKATAVLTTSDRTEFVQLVRSNHKWLVVPPERERVDF